MIPVIVGRTAQFVGWTEFAVSWALTAAASVVADSYGGAPARDVMQARYPVETSARSTR